MSPEGLKRAMAANPEYAVCEPLERPTTLLMAEAEGVASKSTAKVPVSLAPRASFCQVAPAVMQEGGGGGAEVPASAPWLRVSKTIIWWSTGRLWVRTLVWSHF